MSIPPLTDVGSFLRYAIEYFLPKLSCRHLSWISMPREADLSNVERAFILDALSQNVRLDGRALDHVRKLELTLNDDYGNCTVQLGKTKYAQPIRWDSRRHLLLLLTDSRVDTRISAEVTKPLEERKFDGIFAITAELCPLASPAFEVGRYAGFLIQPAPVTLLTSIL
jgi:exosome complex RNA-binding protein Rrp42 (RNase PH superfamily)